MLRPWPAEDGLLVRLRLVGGRVSARTLLALVTVAEQYGDSRVHLTGRANLQLRALPCDAEHPGRLDRSVRSAIEATGLLPSARHDLVRNLLVSPQTGRAGGRADLRPIAAELDRRICAVDRLGDLPGRFLFVLDDGRGDLLDRETDLGLVCLDVRHAQLRIGTGWGPVVALTDAPARLVDLAEAFLDARGHGAAAPWHVHELVEPLTQEPADPRLPAATGPLPYGEVPGGFHHRIEDGIDRRLAERLAASSGEDLVVTPWRGVLSRAEPETPR